jgi:hypothetical protein
VPRFDSDPWVASQEWQNWPFDALNNVPNAYTFYSLSVKLEHVLIFWRCSSWTWSTSVSRHRNGLESAREKTNGMRTKVQHDVQTSPFLCSPSMGRKSCRDPLQISLFKTCNIPLILIHLYLKIIPTHVDGAHFTPPRFRFQSICSRSHLRLQTHIRPHRSHPHPCLHRSEHHLELRSLRPRPPGRLNPYSPARYLLRISSFPSQLFSFSSRITLSISNRFTPLFQLFVSS